MSHYFDAAILSEDDRIKLIGETVMRLKSKKTGFMVDKGGEFEGKGDRYIKKLLNMFPLIEVKKRFDGPGKDVETIIVGIKS